MIGSGQSENESGYYVEFGSCGPVHALSSVPKYREAALRSTRDDRAEDSSVVSSFLTGSLLWMIFSKIHIEFHRPFCVRLDDDSLMDMSESILSAKKSILALSASKNSANGTVHTFLIDCLETNFSFSPSLTVSHFCSSSGEFDCACFDSFCSMVCMK